MAIGRGIKGTWRVYFNSRHEYPLIWSVDDGSTEHEGVFSAVVIHGRAVSVFDKVAADTGMQPRAWFEIEGEMVIEKTVAVIWGATHARQNV